MEIIIDDFKGGVDILLEKLEAGDRLYMEEPPRDIKKFISIHSYTHRNGIEVYVSGKPVESLL